MAYREEWRTAHDDCILTSVDVPPCREGIGDAISRTWDERCLGGLAEWPRLVLAVTQQDAVPEYLPHDGWVFRGAKITAVLVAGAAASSKTDMFPK